MSITGFHAKYLAHELTKRNASGGFTRIADAQVDLNPHQIEAALAMLRCKSVITQEG